MILNKNFSKLAAVSSFSVLASVLAVGCGGAPQPYVNSSVLASTPTVTPYPVQVYNPVSIFPTPSPTPIATNLNGTYNYSFQLQNTTRSCNNGGTPTPSGVNVGTYSTSGISTDNIFKVTVTSASPTTLPCTGYTANYSCVQYTITVGSRSQTATVSYGTPPQGSPCALINAASSVTLDFSDQATTGHGALSVKVSQIQSDNCRANQWAYAMYGTAAVQAYGCAMTPVYDNQIVSGTLGVITNRL